MARWLVTGVGRGIGLELARALLARGDEVIGTVRNAGELAMPGLTLLTMDVSSTESVRAARAAYRGAPIDVLINNAGMTGGPQKAPGMDLARAESIVSVNALGPLRVYDAFVDCVRLAKAPRRIVNVSSEAGSLSAFRASGKPEYAMSKAALNALTRWIAAKEEQTICVSLHPGWTRTATGGEGAPQSATEAAQKMIAAVDALTVEHGGGFFDTALAPIAW